MRARGVEFDVVNYMDTPLDRKTIEEIIKKMSCEPGDLLRVTDAKFKAAGLTAKESYSAKEVTEILLSHGEVMQRPVVVKGNKAIIARPPNLVEELL